MSKTNDEKIGALYGFMTSLRKLIKTYQPNKCILFWDGENGGKDRYLIDENYKANREHKSWYNKITLTEKEINYQNYSKQSELWNRTQIKKYCEELYIRQIEVPLIEADDLIAQYVMTHNNVEEMILFTNDRDFMQLLDYELTIHVDGLDYPITKNNSFMYFPYFYKNALTLKVICGDDSDNIQGIEGAGINVLIKYFPEIKDSEVKVKDILIKARKINEERVSNKKKPIKLLENLINGVDRLVINHKLMNLSQPFLNENALNELDTLDYPLSDGVKEGIDRGSKVLYKYMVDDGFLNLYSTYGNFIDYVQPFYIIIAKEKEFYQNYLTNH